MRQLTTTPLLLLLAAYSASAQPAAETPPPHEAETRASPGAPPENRTPPAPGENLRSVRQRMQREQRNSRPATPPATPPPAAAKSSVAKSSRPSEPPRKASSSARTTATLASSAATPASASGPSCEEIRKQARFNVYFEKVDIDKLVQTVSDATCRTFILPENIRGKISIVGPENGRIAVSADEFYAAFLAALDANGFSVYRQGKFQRIVEKQRAKNYPIPTLSGSETFGGFADQMITKMFRLKYIEVENARTVLQQLVSPSGDVLSIPPNGLIINDLASNLSRLEKILSQLDLRPSGEEIRAIQIQYATATSIAEKIEKLFEAPQTTPAARRPGGTGGRGGPPPSSSSDREPSSTLTQLIPDERTNKLIVVASPAALESIQALIRELDIPIAGEGSIHVHPLENANAEEIAQTLQVFAQASATAAAGAQARRAGAGPARAGAGGARTTTDTFQGEVRISADKSTNALVITANQADYRALARVIEKLDIPRRQVFVEAVIMEVSLDRSMEFGIHAHQGFKVSSSKGDVPGVIGTNYGKSTIPPSLGGLAGLASMGGFLAGLQGTELSGVTIGNITLPAFGIILQALQTDSDANILSTPHLLTLDNEEAEIVVGQNIPMQAGYSMNPFGNVAALGGLSGTTGGSTNLLSGLGGFGPQINRQDVQLKLTIKPQVNDSDYVRLVINKQIEGIVSTDPMLGPTTSKRIAKTTIVAKDQETVVIGGLMEDRIIENVSKIPFFGDIPIIGHLFRSQTKRKTKTNLLMFLTPYIIRDSSDFRRILERKLNERQIFVEQFYGAATGYDLFIDYARKPGPIARIEQLSSRELRKFEHGGSGLEGERLISPVTNPQAPQNTSEPVLTPLLPQAPLLPETTGVGD